MADILIKLDKGIPKTHESLVIDEDNEVRIYGTDVVIGEAIELPSVGRWIVGQELKAFLKHKMCDVRCAECKMNCDFCVVSTLFKIIDKSPTLVCEEGENPDGSDN